MKRFVAPAAFFFCFALVLFSDSALNAARIGVDIWWNTLLPTLFPLFVCATIIDKSGALHRLAHACVRVSSALHINSYALPVLLLGAVSGYPSGARLCGMLQAEGRIPVAEAERLGSLCNLCSPLFLVGAVAGTMFGNPQLFIPLALGHYTSAILCALLFRCKRPAYTRTKPQPIPKTGEPLVFALPNAIATGMSDITKIGGCVIFFLVLSETLKKTGVFHIIGVPIDLLFSCVAVSPADGILTGILEMTGGCYKIAQSGLAVQQALPICAFLISFGGLSIFVQSMSFFLYQKPLRYLGIKFTHGLLSAGMTYAWFACFPQSAAAFSSTSSPLTVNIITSATILVANTLAMATAFLITVLSGKVRPAQK